MDPSAGGAERAGRARMQVEAGDDGSAVQWGEFQGTWTRDREDGDVQGRKLLHGWWTDDRWEAFADTDNGDVNSLELCADGQWWRDDSTLLCTGAAHQSTDTVSLEQIFENCFPSLTAPVTDDDIKPLGPPEIAAGDLAASPECSRSSSFLQRDLRYKWEGSRLHSSYLSSLHIDPNDKIPPQKNKFLATSPALKEKQQAHKASKESELKLVKVASVSVHVSGFSPSHHLQSLFQHWTQSQAKPRLKVAYEFKHRLLV